ncbi:MAG: PQQ-dependent sugar dehydrogenase, partial [Tepidisphaeraceae bacterium]
DSFFERGLLGIAFDPSFNANAPGTDYVYLYFTVPTSLGGGPNNRISRFEVNGNTIDPLSQTTILNLNNLSAGNHNGGGLHFGPDGMLYVGAGENAVGANAQSISNLLGKILRVNPDPEKPIPDDNPTSFAGIAGSPTGDNRAIWAVGLRNPFTHAWHPVTGRLMINDVGQNTWEEIDDGIAGRNYGWPSTEGDFNQATFPNFTRPLYTYQHGAGIQRGNTIAGGAFYSTTANQQFPATYQGKYFFGDYINDWIAYIDPNAPPTTNNHTNFATVATDIVDLKVGPDGALYYLLGGATGNGVRRVRPDPGLAPRFVQIPEGAIVEPGAIATFAGAAIGTGTITYKWQRNGVDIGGATSSSYSLPNVTLADSGAQFRLVASSSIGITYS